MKIKAFLICLCLVQSLFSNSQVRQIHLDTTNTSNEIVGLSFLNSSEGFAACTEAPTDWIGYTQDSGRTFIKRHITLSNVNFNGFPVNLTFGFALKGVQAFLAFSVPHSKVH